METKWVVSPEVIIRHVGEILDGPVVDGIGIEKEVMSKGLEDQKWTFNEWVPRSQILVVPEKGSLECR
jgi:hypothetical protein